ncbi:uncharacterized protein LOC133296520 [Gastrolobium bilobum]|uniref:uncharacterized protein LOC133296520 n=1 Tax=Gastrolobium bilobum TaxID=150636 RepID=UPI002AB0F8F8|nr:uncharacterized protein LOC133296520 [Gastrolobium bilobum]
MKVRLLALFLLISGTQAISMMLPKFGSIEDSIRLKDKVEESKNENKHELFNTTRKAQGGSKGASGKRGRTGVNGSADVNRQPRRPQNSAPSLLSGPHFRASTFIYVSLALTIGFPFNYV